MKTPILILAALAALTCTAPAQSILTSPPETPAQTAARESVLALQGIRTSNIGMLRDAVGRAFPPGVDPQEVVTLWGVNAGAIFALFDGHIAYLQAVAAAGGDTAAVAEIQAIISPVPPVQRRTVHQDGTVTITPPEEP